MTPAFTPPSVTVGFSYHVGDKTLAMVSIASPYRMYSAFDPVSAVAEVRALEAALHAEYAKLEAQRALVADLKARWQTARKTLYSTPTPTP